MMVRSYVVPQLNVFMSGSIFISFFAFKSFMKTGKSDGFAAD